MNPRGTRSGSPGRANAVPSIYRRAWARDLLLCLDEDKGWKRYPLSIRKTLAELRTRRGRTVIVQNPSMVLAALACLFRKPLGYALVVDRHSNFSHLAQGKTGLKRRLSDLLSDYTIRNANLTIVTNRELAEQRGTGGRPRLRAPGSLSGTLSRRFPGHESGRAPPAGGAQGNPFRGLMVLRRTHRGHHGSLPQPAGRGHREDYGKAETGLRALAPQRPSEFHPHRIPGRGPLFRLDGRKATR